MKRSCTLLSFAIVAVGQLGPDGVGSRRIRLICVSGKRDFLSQLQGTDSGVANGKVRWRIPRLMCLRR